MLVSGQVYKCYYKLNLCIMFLSLSHLIYSILSYQIDDDDDDEEDEDWSMIWLCKGRSMWIRSAPRRSSKRFITNGSEVDQYEMFKHIYTMRFKHARYSVHILYLYLNIYILYKYSMCCDCEIPMCSTSHFIPWCDISIPSTGWHSRVKLCGGRVEAFAGVGRLQ